MDEQRSPAARKLSELALVRLLHELGPEQPFLVVLGGLVPELLARDGASPPSAQPSSRSASATATPPTPDRPATPHKRSKSHPPPTRPSCELTPWTWCSGS